MPRPLRTSCDRCHSQKLRCPKEPGVATCTRCLRAGTRCDFSPAGPAVRRAASAVTPVYNDDFSFQASLDDGLGAQFDWQRLDFDCTMTPPLETIQSGQPEPDQGAASSSSPSLEDPRSACVRQLTTLAVDLDNVHRNMPAASTLHIPKYQSIEGAISQYAKTFDTHRSLELLLSSAQVLIDVYPDILKLLFNHEGRADDCQNGDGCIHLAEDMSVTNKYVPWSEDVMPKVDIFVFNLLTLCHARLLDIFGKLVGHVTLCAKISMAYPNDKESRVRVPELRIGSFVASASSSSKMEAVLLTHVASVLKTRAQQLSNKLVEAIGCDHDDKLSRMLRLPCEVLEEKSGIRVEQLQQIMERLNSLGAPICS